jgi:hypothetical protein
LASLVFGEIRWWRLSNDVQFLCSNRNRYVGLYEVGCFDSRLFLLNSVLLRDSRVFLAKVLPDRLKNARTLEISYTSRLCPGPIDPGSAVSILSLRFIESKKMISFQTSRV